MIARLAWTAMLIACALIATFAQLDRSARFNPAYAPAVPAPFRGFALQKLVQSALIAEDRDQSLILARDLLRVRPAPAEHLALLAQAEILAGNQQAALAALQAAGTRGWREPVSQRAMAEAALVTGNYEIAVQRIAALLATGQLDSEATQDLVTRIAETAEGRDALATALADQGYWQARFAGQAQAYLPPEEFAEVISLAVSRGADLPCAVLERVATRFERAGNGELASQFYPGNCP